MSCWVQAPLAWCTLWRIALLQDITACCLDTQSALVIAAFDFAPVPPQWRLNRLTVQHSTPTVRWRWDILSSLVGNFTRCQRLVTPGAAILSVSLLLSSFKQVSSFSSSTNKFDCSGFTKIFEPVIAIQGRMAIGGVARKFCIVPPLLGQDNKCLSGPFMVVLCSHCTDR